MPQPPKLDDSNPLVKWNINLGNKNVYTYQNYIANQAVKDRESRSPQPSSNKKE